jgi:hypothetical protein
MKNIASFITLIVFIAFVPASTVSAITVSPFEYGSQIDADDSASGAWGDGRWHLLEESYVYVSSDAGYFGPAYALFDFSLLTKPAAGGFISFEILRHSGSHAPFPGYYDWPFPMALWDVADIEALSPPAEWPSQVDYMASFYSVKQDLTSGVGYGSFLVPPDSEGMSIEVLLTDAAIAGLNASLGGLFGIGIGPGESINGFYFPSEGHFVALSNAQLHIQPVPEPGTLLLLGIGLAAAGHHVRRNKPRKR